MSKKFKGPKILVIDIETSPLISYTWGMFEQNVGLNQIKKDWSIIAFSAKWLGSKKVFYKDLRGKKDLSDDRELLKIIWKLMDKADIVLGQNSRRFDVKKVFARFLLNGFPPPSSFRHLDTLQIMRKNFALTSNKLEYATKMLCTKHKKLVQRKFSGFDLWKECLGGNRAAWAEMERYNKADVLSTEELYKKLQAWDNSINVNVYHNREETVCKCGSESFSKNGFLYTATGRYQRFKCNECSSETRSKANLLSIEKRTSLRK